MNTQWLTKEIHSWGVCEADIPLLVRCDEGEQIQWSVMSFSRNISGMHEVYGGGLSVSVQQCDVDAGSPRITPLLSRGAGNTFRAGEQYSELLSGTTTKPSMCCQGMARWG